MSSQSGTEVPFYISTLDDNCLLLEVSEKIAASLDQSSEAPKLKLKSFENGHAVLCVGETAHELRQVQTSNSVHVVRPYQDGADASSSSQPGTVATSKCGSVLELGDIVTGSAEPFLRALLPPYDANDGLEWPRDTPRRSMQEVFDDVPLADAACMTAWRRMHVFQQRQQQGSWVPTSRALVKAWSAIMSAFLVDGQDLDSAISEDWVELHISTVQDVPGELATTILANLMSTSESGERLLDRKTTVIFIGEAILQDLGITGTDDFVRQWQNLLPEKWRQMAEVQILEGVFEVAGPGMIQPVGTSAKTAAAAPKVDPARRKWHDKFKASRKR